MKITIITATYNSAATLRDTIKSVLSQSYPDYEYVVIDGGSKDGTIDVIKELEPKFNGKMRWISEPDKGIYDAMNKGLKMATGDVIGILNSDDFYTSDDILQTIVENIDSVDAVYGDIHYVSPDDLTKCVRTYSSKHFRPWKLRFGYMPAHPSFYARREAYEKVGLYSLEYKLAADYEIMVRFFCKHHIKAKYIEKDFVTMRTGGASNQDIISRLLLTKEDALACRQNGVFSCFAMCCVKYITKIFEFKTL